MHKLHNIDRYDEIRECVADFIEDYGISCYPFSMIDLLTRIGIKIVPYSCLPQEVHEGMIGYYPNGVTRRAKDFDIASSVIFYNDSQRKTRIRFTLAHELAQLILEHPNSDGEYETEADIFANYLLAPAPIVIRDSFNDIQAIMDDFNVGHDCARSIQDRTANRIRCRKPAYEYENRISNLCRVDRGGRVACV